MKKIVAIVQARMGSTRLPGKVMRTLLGEPMLFHEMARIGRSKRIHTTVVATTHSSADNTIQQLCIDQGWPYFRGSESDVLDRYYRAAEQFGADIIVRLTSDCPLIDPALIDRVIDTFVINSPDIDYVSNTLPSRTFPRGLDTEVVSFDVLEKSWREDKNPLLREHVTQYILQNPEKFRILGVTNNTDLSHLRWTVDTMEDFQLVDAIYSSFGHNHFSWYDVMALIEKKPELSLINQHISQKEVFHL